MGPSWDHADPTRALFTNTGENWADYKAMVIGWAVAIATKTSFLDKENQTLRISEPNHLFHFQFLN
jgi:hypothetical protein